MLTGKQRIGAWISQVVVAVIFLQTLFFKFTGAPEAVHIFSTLGVEPWGRLATGGAELVASILLLIPVTAAFGALFSMGILAGAIFSHLFTPLGIVVLDDGGTLFAMALVAFVLSGVVAFLRRDSLPIIGGR